MIMVVSFAIACSSMTIVLSGTLNELRAMYANNEREICIISTIVSIFLFWILLMINSVRQKYRISQPAQWLILDGIINRIHAMTILDNEYIVSTCCFIFILFICVCIII